MTKALFAVVLSTFTVGCAGFSNTLASISTTVQAGGAKVDMYCPDQDHSPWCEAAQSTFVVADDALGLAQAAEAAGRLTEQLVANAKLAADNFWTALNDMFKARARERSRMAERAKAHARGDVVLPCEEYVNHNTIIVSPPKEAPRPIETDSSTLTKPRAGE